MKILYVTGGSPWPLTMGVNQRTHLLYKALSECGEVDLIINSQYVRFDEDEKNFFKEKYRLRALVNPIEDVRINEVNRNRSLPQVFKKKLRDWFGTYLTNNANLKYIQEKISLDNYNVIVARYLGSAVNTGLSKYAPIVLDVDDLNIDVISNRVKYEKSNGYKKVALIIYNQLVRMIEQRFLSKFEFLWFTKDADRDIVKNKKSSVLPNIPVIDYSEIIDEKGLQEDNVALFVGSMRYPVNVKGIDRFVKNVWPKIKLLQKDAVLRIVGTGMTEKQKAEWNRWEGIQAIGFVDRIASEYSKVAFSIIPLYEGGGTKIKLIESLAYGRACVTTNHSMKGYENILKDGEDISIAENDRAFVSKCIELYRDRQKRTIMGLRGKEKIKANFTYNGFKKVVEESLFSVAGKRKIITLR